MVVHMILHRQNFGLCVTQGNNVPARNFGPDVYSVVLLGNATVNLHSLRSELQIFLGNSSFPSFIRSAKVCTSLD
jgi:hypothetical protein